MRYVYIYTHGGASPMCRTGRRHETFVQDGRVVDFNLAMSAQTSPTPDLTLAVTVTLASTL